MKVAILIPTWNNLKYLEQCVSSIQDLTTHQHRIIVVSNGCTDDTTEWCKHRSVEVLELPDNKGFAGGLNAAIPMVRPDEHLLILNDDTRVVDPWWLSRMTHALEGNEGVGAVGPISNCVVGAQMFELVGLPLVHETPMLCGFCLLVSSDAIKHIYPLDEGYGPAGTDDMWMCLRSAGYKLLVDRTVFVFHWSGVTTRRFKFESDDLRNRFDAKWGVGSMHKAFKELEDVMLPYSPMLVKIIGES